MFGHLNHNRRFTMDSLIVQFHSTIKRNIKIEFKWAISIVCNIGC